MAKVTKKEVLTKVVDGIALTDEDIEVVKGMIESLAKKSSKPTKAQVANEGIKAEIAEFLTSKPVTAKEIADALGISTNKVAALAKQIEGVVIVPAKGKHPSTYAIGE
jgi:predicted transcriptional regulator